MGNRFSSSCIRTHWRARRRSDALHRLVSTILDTRGLLRQVDLVALSRNAHDVSDTHMPMFSVLCYIALICQDLLPVLEDMKVAVEAYCYSCELNPRAAVPALTITTTAKSRRLFNTMRLTFADMCSSGDGTRPFSLPDVTQAHRVVYITSLYRALTAAQCLRQRFSAFLTYVHSEHNQRPDDELRTLCDSASFVYAQLGILVDLVRFLLYHPHYHRVMSSYIHQSPRDEVTGAFNKVAIPLARTANLRYIGTYSSFPEFH